MKIRHTSIKDSPTTPWLSANFFVRDGGKSYMVLNRSGAQPLLYGLDGKAQLTISQEPVADVAFRRLTGTKVETEIALAVPSGHEVNRINIDQQKLLPPLRPSITRPTRVAYGEARSLLAVGNAYGEVSIWNLEKSKPVKVTDVSLARRPVVSLSFNSTSDILYAAVASGRVYEIDVQYKQLLEERPNEVADDRTEYSELKGGRLWTDFECRAVAAHPTVPDLVAIAGTGQNVWLRNQKTKALQGLDLMSMSVGNMSDEIKGLVFASASSLIVVGNKQVVVLGGKGGLPLGASSVQPVAAPWHRESDLHKVLGAGLVKSDEVLVVTALRQKAPEFNNG